MTPPTPQPAPRRWTKRYQSAAACRTAAANHHWLTDLAAPVPTLTTIGDDHLEFDHVHGRHAEPRDLPQLASLLGDLHRAAYAAELHLARLDRPHTTSTGLTIPDFLAPRRAAVQTLLTSGAVPAPAFTATEALRTLESAVTHQACLYKDSNPRNFLITTTGTGARAAVLVDFDVLTLAPAGYDLAKLIVTLTMTYGSLPTTEIDRALSAYNTALTQAPTSLKPVHRAEMMTWAAIHHILTSPYLGRGGYHYTWTNELG
jgi:hypothetical protein